MYQIISKEYTNRTHAKANMIKIEIDELIETLDVKGSDEYSFFCSSFFNILFIKYFR